MMSITCGTCASVSRHIINKQHRSCEYSWCDPQICGQYRFHANCTTQKYSMKLLNPKIYPDISLNRTDSIFPLSNYRSNRFRIKFKMFSFYHDKAFHFDENVSFQKSCANKVPRLGKRMWSKTVWHYRKANTLCGQLNIKILTWILRCGSANFTRRNVPFIFLNLNTNVHKKISRKIKKNANDPI